MQFRSRASREHHRTHCFQVQNIEDDKDHKCFMGRWEKGGCKCAEESIPLDICSLKGKSYR